LEKQKGDFMGANWIVCLVVVIYLLAMLFIGCIPPQKSQVTRTLW